MNGVIRAKWYGEAANALAKDDEIVRMAAEALGQIPNPPTFEFMLAANEEARRRGVQDRYTGPLAIGTVARALAIAEANLRAQAASLRK